MAFVKFVIFAYFSLLLLIEGKTIRNERDLNSNVTERIVTVENTTAIKTGVALDFGFNETNDLSSDDIPSAPGCPKSYEGYPFVYYGTPPLCFLVGTQGPCPPGQLLFGNLTSNYGICGCHCHPGNGNCTKLEVFDQIVEDFPIYRFCHSGEVPNVGEIAFHKENGTCFFLETQGFCKEGEWVVRDTSGENVECVKRCSDIEGPLSTHGFDRLERDCKKKISQTIQPISLAVPIGQQACEDGMVFSKTLHKCIPKSKAYLMKYHV